MKHFSTLLLFLGVSLCFSQFSCTTSKPRVSIETEAGDILLELYSKKAPITTTNFLRYVDEKRYDGTKFYRVVRMDNQKISPVKIEVIQGGLDADSTQKLPTISHETNDKTGLKHLNGTLSMARSKPGSANSEFFICINDQPELDFGGKRNPDGQGFAAFGKVITGMDVVRKIQQGAVTGPVDLPQRLVKTIAIRSIKWVK